MNPILTKFAASNWLLRTATSILTIASTVGCVSNGQKSLKDANLVTSDNNQAVVVQVYGKEPLLSPVGKNYWLDARSTKANSMKRIHGLLATGEAIAAEKEARLFLSKNPANMEALTALTSALVQSGQYDLAAYYAKIIARKIPDSSFSLNVQGLATLMDAAKIDDFRNAEQLFRQSFESSPNEVAAGLNLGHLYLELGNSKSAQRIFNEVRNRCADCVPALMGYGIASRRNGDHSEAIDVLNRVVKTDKANVEAMYHTALVYKDGLNDRKQAEQVLRNLIATDTKQTAIRERAHSVLRSMRSEATPGTAETAKGELKNGDEMEASGLLAEDEDVSTAPMPAQHVPSE